MVAWWWWWWWWWVVVRLPACLGAVVVLALDGLALLVRLRWWCGCRAGLALLAFVVVVVARGDGSDAAGFGSHRRLRFAAGGWSYSAALCCVAAGGPRWRFGATDDASEVSLRETTCNPLVPASRQRPRVYKQVW